MKNELFDFQKTFTALGTVNTIFIPDCRDRDVAEQAAARVRELHDRLSVFSGSSDISRINALAGTGFARVHPDTIFILKEAVRYAELSGGSFDITVRPLVELWGIGKKLPSIPDEKAIIRARGLVNYHDILIDEAAGAVMLLRPGQAVDLGGIAKGYAADEVRRILRENGVKEAVINLGGTVIVMGKERPVGIQHPDRPTGTPMGFVMLSDQAAVTSGAYERYMTVNNKRYHHILSTKTGYPAETGLLSVTLIGDSAMELDALTTAVFTEGLEQGLRNVPAGRISFVVITDRKDVLVSQELRDSFKFVCHEVSP